MLFGAKLWIIARLFISTSAVKIFDKTTVPSNLTTACTNALLGDLNCSPFVTALRGDAYYSQKALERTCKPDCDGALSTYSSTIANVCGKQLWSGYDNVPELVTTIPDLMRYNFDLVCLRDSDRYCNVVAAANAAASDLACKFMFLRCIICIY
jgi:hypothetical protein